MGRYGTRKLLGTRDVVGEEDEIQPNGQIFRYISAVKKINFILAIREAELALFLVT